MSAKILATALIPRPAEPLIYPEVLPDEIWHRILSLICDGSNTSEGFRGVCACASISRTFLAFCLENCAHFRMHHVLLHHLPSPTTHLELKALPHGKALSDLCLLAVDQKGRYYFRSYQHPIDCHFYILHPSNEGFKLIRLNLFKIIHEEKKIKLTVDVEIDSLLNDFTQSIVSCHPTERGFIVVTRSGVSIWEYDENGDPEFKNFVSPFPKYSITHTEIKSSAFQNNILCLNANLRKQELEFGRFMINIETCEVFEVLDTTGLNPSHYFFTSTGGRLGMVSRQGYSYTEHLYQEIAIEDVVPPAKSNQIEFPSSYAAVYSQEDMEHWKTSRKKKLVLVGEPTKFSGRGRLGTLEGTRKWSVMMIDTEITILNSDQTIHIGKRDGLIHSIAKGYLSLTDDFLFITEGGSALKAIHLPTKKDYAKKLLLPFLAPYLNVPGTTLHTLAMRSDEENNQMVFDVVFLRKGAFFTVSIPLQSSFNQPTLLEGNESEVPLSPPLTSDLLTTPRIPPKPRLIKPARSTTTRPAPETQSSPQFAAAASSPCSLTDGKIIVAAGIILLLLTAAGGALLMVLHPGTVLYQGSGIVLTLPAVVTLSVGGSFSLVIIAIGSYRWWKSRQTL